MSNANEDAIAEFRNAPYNAKDKSIDRAMNDYKLPTFVRGFLVLASLPATEKLTLAEADMLPPLYAKLNGRPCRVTLVSSMGDIGIAWDNRTHGYNERGLSIYDLTDFSREPLFGK